MRSKRHRFLSIAALLWVALCAGGLTAPAAPSCIAKYSVAIFEALGEDSQATSKVFQIVKGFGPDAQKGVVAFLGSSTLDGADLSATFENFAGFQGAAVLDHPLQTGDALFGAIGQISSNVDSVPGFSETLAQLAQDVNTSAAQGAAMDIAVARDYKLNNTLIGFQQTVPSAAGNRIYDVTAACSSCPGGILYNEDKNWSTALSVDASGAVNDLRLSDFLQTQFDKDIIIQSPTQFQSFQINLRTVVQPQQQLIVNAMLARFDNPSPTVSALTSNQITAARAAFLARVQTGKLFTFR